MATKVKREVPGAHLMDSEAARSIDPVGEKPDTAAERQFPRAVAAITILAAVLYILVSACWPKFSRAEVFFAESAREMIAASNYITPLYHGQGFFDKPILCYWFIIGCFKTFGITHFVSRIPSILASLATIVATAYACRAAFGARAALLAAMALSTSFMYLSFSALCMSDSMLVLVDTVTLTLMYLGFRAEEGSRSTKLLSNRSFLWFLAAASMGIGFLTKGPVAVVLPAVAFLAYLLIERKLSLVKIKHLLLGLLAVAIIGAPWFYMAYQANGMEAITYFFLRENVQRFAGATYDTHKPIWFMVLSLMGGYLPWSIFLPPILFVSIKRWIEQRKTVGETTPAAKQLASLETFLWLWIAVAIGFFSVSRGKIDYYALPAFPACAMLTGYYLSGWISEGNKFAKAAAALMNVALLVASVGIGLLIGTLSPSGAGVPWAIVLLPIAAAIVGFVAIGKNKIMTAYVTVFSGVVLAGSAFALAGMPRILALLPPLDYAETIKATAPANAGIGIYSELWHWVDEVTFRTEREPVKLASETDLQNYLSTPGAHWLMIKTADFNALSQDARDRLEIVDRRGFIPKSITPGYIIGHKGNLTGGSELILARSK